MIKAGTKLLCLQNLHTDDGDFVFHQDTYYEVLRDVDHLSQVMVVNSCDYNHRLSHWYCYFATPAKIRALKLHHILHGSR